jgi:hypothetical protein
VFGFAQWVNNLVTFKAACEETYIKEKLWKRNKSPMQIKNMYDNFTGESGPQSGSQQAVVWHASS